MTRRNFKREVSQAACNPQLALALGRATAIFAAKRAEIYADVDFKAVQAQINEIKVNAIANLPALVEQFKEEAEKAGAVVYDPVDADAAARRVLGIMQTRGAKRAVKSKSMLTEEIDLNKVLIDAGIKVTETDLGEWIIQLAGERPSHFVGPAIHKTREQVAELFSRELGREIPADRETLVQVARQQLREEFIAADVGISGANVAIADTGTIVIVTNEGNSRLVTTLPPVHIALVGIEKIVPDLIAAATIVRYLPKSAAGQKMTAYVSFITGPSKTADIELTLTTGVHGPKEVHIVLVDNGRERLRTDEGFREALYCVKCGACLNVCPVFRVVGGHVFGHVYNGGIGSVLTAFLHGLDEAVDPLRLCATCHRCVEVCTAGIDIPRLVVALRQRTVRQKGLSLTEGIAFKSILSNQRRFQSVLGFAKKAQKIVSGNDDMIDRLPFFLSSLTSFRSLPRLAEVPLRERWKAKYASSGETGRQLSAAFFAGCMIDFVYPEIGESVAHVLEKRGVSVVFPQEQGCCGLPATYSGDADTGRLLAKQTIETLETAGAAHVVTACPTCTSALRNEFPRLLAGDGDWEDRAKKLAERVYDFAHFLVRVAPPVSDEAGIPEVEKMKVTYHDSCHLRFAVGVDAEPRQLIKDSGAHLIEMKDPDACCGCAGTFSLKFPEVSQAMLNEKMSAINATGADAVITGCPACLLQIKGGLRKQGGKVKALHLAQLLDQR